MIGISEKIQNKIYEYGEKIKSPKNLLIVNFKKNNDGIPYVNIEDSIFYYISSDRDYDLFEKTTSSFDELMYWILDRIVSRMAMDYELSNRVQGQDSRRIYFSKKLELIGKINPAWRQQAKENIDEILKSSPYIDFPHSPNDSFE